MNPPKSPPNNQSKHAFFNAMRGFPGGYTHSFANTPQTPSTSWPNWKHYLDNLLADLLEHYSKSVGNTPSRQWQLAMSNASDSIKNKQETLKTLLCSDFQLNGFSSAWLEQMVIPHFCESDRWTNLLEKSQKLLSDAQQSAKDLLNIALTIPHQALEQFQGAVATHANKATGFKSLNEVQSLWYECWDNAFTEVLKQPETKRHWQRLIELTHQSKETFIEFQQLGWNEMGLATRQQWENVQRKNVELMKNQKDMQEQIQILNERITYLESLILNLTAKRA